MSALPATYLPSFEPIYNELDATREISRLACRATDFEEGLEAISSVLLGVPGVWRVCIEAPQSWRFDRVGRTAGEASASAVAPVEAGRGTWGKLRIHFEVRSEVGASPVRFVKFVAQQIAGLLDRLTLQRERDSCVEQISILRRRIETRKMLARASGLIARRDRISEAQALSAIATLARRNRRSLLLIAQSVIFLEANSSAADQRVRVVFRKNRAAGQAALRQTHRALLAQA